MLWTISVMLTIIWLLGLVTGHGIGYFIHIPLFIAIIVMLIKIEVDCRDTGSDQLIISPPTYKKE